MKTIRICPKCGSIDLEKDDKKGLTYLGGISPNYKCNSCKFSSPLFPEIDIENIKKFRKNLKDSKSKKKK